MAIRVVRLGTPRRARYRRGYLRQMRTPHVRRLIQLLAALSATTNFSIGCYCEDESHCNRSLLRELPVAAGARLA